MKSLEEIKESDKLCLTSADVAPVIKCDPAKIRETAMRDPRLLGFPVSVIGRRVHIWRKGFLKYIGEM